MDNTYERCLNLYKDGMKSRMEAKEGEKTPWKDETPFYLYDQLRERAILFENALQDDDIEYARKLAFDVGNYSWMLLDRLEALDVD